MRQLLADKMSGNLAGIWLLVAEHLRLGTWDLLRGWTGSRGDDVEPRLALQLVHEAAVCTSGIRSQRTLQGRSGFELANGLPFVATDQALHELLSSKPIARTQELQVALGCLRRTMGHFVGKLLAVDPHRIKSHSRRRMRPRSHRGGRPEKQSQTFWLLDAATHQPVCFTTATAATSVVDATPHLLALAEKILSPVAGEVLVVADSEHFSSDLFHEIAQRSVFDLLVPLPCQPAHRRRWQALPHEQFHSRWAGFATAKSDYEAKYGRSGRYVEIVQRYGERCEDYSYKGFLCTRDRDEVEALAVEFPQRWHIEEFFNANQDLGWQRAGTQNLNIRYGQMTMALIAQTVLHELRNRLGAPYSTWDANHFAKDLFFRLEGDVRVTDDTILVTYYNAPDVERLRTHYEHLPERLDERGISPNVPWLYGYKLDFRFC